MSYKPPHQVQILGEHIHEHQLRYHQREVLVSREFTFDSAHHLHCYDGKCASMHGHTYRLQVIMRGTTDERGIVIDFADIKRITQERVLSKLDHQYLNDVLPPMNTTAENMVVWIYEQIKEGLAAESAYAHVVLEEVRLWETPSSYATVKREFMEG